MNSTDSEGSQNQNFPAVDINQLFNQPSALLAGINEENSQDNVPGEQFDWGQWDAFFMSRLQSVPPPVDINLHITPLENNDTDLADIDSTTQFFPFNRFGPS
jgi:hypothetical protein